MTDWNEQMDAAARKSIDGMNGEPMSEPQAEDPEAVAARQAAQDRPDLQVVTAINLLAGMHNGEPAK